MKLTIATNSSMITAAGYDEERQALRVKFKNGKVFEYSGVTLEEKKSLLAAESFGAYFSRFIKPEHDAKPIEEDDRPKCKVNGVLAPNAMCGRVSVRVSKCSAEGECEHKETVKPAPIEIKGV